MKNIRKSKRYSSDSPSSESSLLSSSSSSESESDDQNNGGDLSSSRKRHHSHRHKKNKHRKEKSLLKPIPPKTYDGAPDARSYHQFIRESEAYIRDGKVRGRGRKVFILSHFLEGKAYDFYTQKVAINENKWDLSRFFKELFDYCFPIDYRMQIRKRLA